MLINPPPPPPKLIPSESYLDKKDTLELDALGSNSSHIHSTLHSEFSYQSSSNKSSYRSNQSTPMSIESNYSYGCSSFPFINNASNVPSWPHGPSHSSSWNGNVSSNSSWTDLSSNKNDLSSQTKSSIRESLDSRIELLLKQQHIGLAPSFLGELGGMSGMGSPSFHSKDFSSSYEFTESFGSKLQISSSSYNEEHKCESLHRNDETDAILGTPPSPFLSGADYMKWYKVTKAIDSGKEPCFESDDSDDDNESDSKDAPLNGNEEDDATPVKDEPMRTVKKRSTKSKIKKFSENNKHDGDDGDDRMSLSSLSSGEKLQVTSEDPSSTSGIVHHPMCPSEQVQMMARLGIWKPGMGSGEYSMTPRGAHQSFSTPTPVGSHFQPFPFSYPLTNLPITASTRPHFSAFPFTSPGLYANFPLSGFLPVPGQPRRQSTTAATSSSVLPSLSSSSSSNQRSHKQKKSGLWHHKALEARKSPITSAVLEKVITELKEIIKKDICKKMIEMTAFKSFESWWDENESCLLYTSDAADE